jgi:hypothetical protein
VLFTEDSNKVMVQGNSKDNSNFIINYFKVADLIQKQVLIFSLKIVWNVLDAILK